MIPQAPVRLADVLESACLAVTGRQGVVPFSSGHSVVVIVVDGLGASNLAARSGHARTFSRRLNEQGPAARIVGGFPSTTVAQLTSLTTGVLPGQHGLVGYSLREPVSGTVRNLVSGWSRDMVPEEWQPVPTLFERLSEHAIPSYAYGPAKYKGSPFTRAFLRGAEYRGIEDIFARIESAVRMAASQLCVVYAYVSDLDAAGHKHGWQSQQWLDALEATDSAVAAAVGLRGGASIALTADHGMVDATERIYLDEFPGFADAVCAVGGEPRCPQLYLRDGGDAVEVADALRSWLPGRTASAFSRDAVISGGWFGPVTEPARERMGDVLVPCLDTVTAAYDRSSCKPKSLEMVGQHGSITDEELSVPLLVWAS